MSEIDDILFGPFMTQKDIRCHYFCLLFFHDLVPNGCDIRDMAGYVVDDIKACVDQIKKNKWKCYYCKGPNPASVCCKKACRKRFHLPCAMKNHCLARFYDLYETFCDEDAKKMIVRDELPAKDQICEICYDSLGEYNPVSCFQPPCCVQHVKEKEHGKTYWMHYRCVMKGARELGYYFNCFAYSCFTADAKARAEDREKAKQGYLDLGIYIPKRDALYESGDHFKKLDKPITDEEYLETTYDQDATIFQRTFILEEEEIDCDYSNRCVGSKLGMRDIVTCGIEGCDVFVHVKCIRYYRDLKSNKAAREEKFFCKECTKHSCLALV